MLEYQKTEITLVKYIARASLAVQLSAPYLSETILNRLPSKFQREMMKVDMEKTLFRQLQQSEFDVLLLDFIDERFSVGLFNGARITLSREFLDANNGEITYLEWNRFSDEKFHAWQRGFAELFDLVVNKVPPRIIAVNKVFFAAKSGDCVDNASICPSFMDAEIQRNNKYLDSLYTYISTNFPSVRFIDYPVDLFVANPRHKWGLAPFHYIDELYLFMLEQLKKLNENM